MAPGIIISANAGNRTLTPFDAFMQQDPKLQLPVLSLPGSQPLSNARHEDYCRLRSLLCPKGQALREAGMRAVKNHDAVSNATRLERRQDVRDRIAFLVPSPAAIPARSTIRAKPPVVKGAPRSEVNTKSDLGS